MPEATRTLTRTPRRRTQDGVELYYGEFDSTYFHGADSSMTKILHETEMKAPFPDVGGPPLTKPMGEFLSGITLQISNAISQAAQAVSDALSTGNTSYSGGSRPSDYYVP